MVNFPATQEGLNDSGAEKEMYDALGKAKDEGPDSQKRGKRRISLRASLQASYFCSAYMDVMRMGGFTYLLRSSTDMYSSSICLSQSISAASATWMQMDMRGWGRSCWSTHRCERVGLGLCDTFLVAARTVSGASSGIVEVGITYKVGKSRVVMFKSGKLDKNATGQKSPGWNG